MVLNEFKTQQITWDKATKKFHEKIEANSGDTNGRKLKVQIINNSLVENLTGVTLNLAWRTKDNSNFGLDVFKVIDATKGIFEISYTTEMLSNVGKLKASLVLIDNVGRTESDEFDIDVKPSVVNDGAIQSENSFTALTEALVKVNEWNGRIDAVEQDYADRAETLEQTYAPKLTEVTSQLAQIATIPVLSKDADNTYAINEALKSSNKISLTSGNFRVDNVLKIDSTKDVHLQGNGIDKTVLDFGKLMFDFLNTPKLTGNLSGPFLGGAVDVVMNTTGLDVGDLIYFASTETMEETSRTTNKNHFSKIVKINSGSIKISVPFPTNFNINNTISFSVYKSGKVILSDMTLTCDYSGGDVGLYLLSVFGLEKPEFRNLKIINRNKGYQGLASDGGHISGFRLTRTLDTIIDNVAFDSIHYGIMPTIGSVGTSIRNCYAENSRHLVAPTGGAQIVRVSDCVTTNCYAGFDSHQTAYDTYFTLCFSYGDEVAAKFRGRYDYIENSHFSYGVELANDPAMALLTGYQKIKKTFKDSVIEKNGLLTTETVSVLIENSDITGLLGFATIKKELTLENVKFKSLETYAQLWIRVPKLIARNVELKGLSAGIDRTNVPSYGETCAIYFDNSATQELLLENIVIDGYDYGVYFVNSFNALNKSIIFRNINFRNCSNVWHTLANYKDFLQIENILMSNCYQYSNDIGRFRYPIISRTHRNKKVSGASVPTIGTWDTGDEVVNTSPTVLGSTGSKYIITGWNCITAGSPGTWVQSRSFTGE